MVWKTYSPPLLISICTDVAGTDVAGASGESLISFQGTQQPVGYSKASDEGMIR